MAHNPRGAGRKKAFPEETVSEIVRRNREGSTISHLAQEYGVSRQTISGYIHAADAEKQDRVCTTYRAWQKLNHAFQEENLRDYTVRMDYMNGEQCCTQILVDFTRQQIRIHNESDFLLERAFGVKVRPDWNDFEEFLEDRCFPRTRCGIRQVLADYGLDSYDPLAIIEKTEGRMAEDFQWIRITYLREKVYV
jgi:hypothetical protein